MLQSQQHLFRAFFSQTTSCDVCNDVIYHPSPINSQYWRRGGLRAMEKTNSLLVVLATVTAYVSCWQWGCDKEGTPLRRTLFSGKCSHNNVYDLSRDRLHIRYHWLCKFLETKRKILHEKGVQSIQELFGTPTWQPNLVPRVFSLSNMAPPPYWKARRPSGRGCMAAVWLFCTPIWLPWLRLKTIKVLGYHVGRTFIWLCKQCGILVNICQRRSSWQDVGSPY